MRINVYSEELTDRTEIVSKRSAEGNDFVGLRLSLKTHEDLVPPKHEDDDTSAVTLWFETREELRDWMRQLMLRHGF